MFTLPLPQPQLCFSNKIELHNKKLGRIWLINIHFPQQWDLPIQKGKSSGQFPCWTNWARKTLSLNKKVLNLAHWYSTGYIPVGILPTSIEIHKSNSNKRLGKNSIMLYFYEGSQLGVLTIGIFMWPLSLRTR